jgi:hypothetical protein
MSADKEHGHAPGGDDPGEEDSSEEKLLDWRRQKQQKDRPRMLGPAG